jgi:transposase
MEPWILSDTEWEQLGELLQASEPPSEGRGRPRLRDDRPAAQACLYRHHHSQKEGYRCFGWNDLPKDFGVSPSTANRRFREWSKSGAWNRFWHALIALRQAGSLPASRQNIMQPEEWIVQRADGRFPVGDILAELERAYLFFNGRFFGGTLPLEVAICLAKVKRSRQLGYFCPLLWKRDERRLGHINIATSVLGQGPERPLEVLLHEMVHLRNEQFGVRDCHPLNQYHGRNFRDVAVLSGLRCGQRDRAHGYAFTELDEAGLAAVKDFAPKEELFHWEVG